MTYNTDNIQFSPLPPEEHLFIKDKRGYHEFFIDKERDKVVLNIVISKKGREFLTSVEFNAAHVYDIYKLLENYLKTPTIEDTE